MQNNNADCASAQAPFPENFIEHDDSENVFGSFELEKVVVTTRMLGRTWGAQVLAVVAKKSCFDCPNCNELLTRVRIGNESYDCEIERPWGDDECIANLIAEHNCSPDDLDDEESA